MDKTKGKIMNEYYHTVISTEEYYRLCELDRTKEETIEEVLKPYKENKTFFFDGIKTSKKDIKSIKIYKTEEKAKVLADIKNKKEATDRYSSEYVVEDDEYSENVTREFMRELDLLFDSLSFENTYKNKKLDLSKVFFST